MKKTLLLIASAALLLMGCAKEQLRPGAAGEGNVVEVSITAGTAMMTKAMIDNDGQADSVKRWIMEVRDASGAVYSRKVDTVTAGTLQHTFNIKLFKNQKYTFAFWADNGGEFYDASDLCAVKYVDGKSVVAGVDAKDAFSGVETLTFSQSISKTIVLHRPFAQLNVITKDLEALRKDAISDDAYKAFKPKNFKTTITVPTQFNVLSGEASEEIELILSADEFYGKSPLSYEDAPKQATMFMAYIFATEGEKDIRKVNFKFDVDSQTGNNTFDFTDVPFQRNYRTNILGNFLSGDAEWTVQIDTVWNTPDEEVKFVEAGSVAAANEAFEKGATYVKITSVGDETTLYLPQTTEEVTIDFANPDKDVTVKCGPAPTKAAGDTPAAVNIATNDVTKFVVSGISNIVWLAGNQDALANALNNAAAGQTVALSNDITMTENWVSVSRGSNTPNFDGRNHAIINMTIKTQEESYAGLFSTIENHVILQNVTFRNALIDIPASIGDNARGGVLVGHMYPSDVVNCHVEGATIKAHQKMGGLIGYVEGDAANKTISIKDCSVKDITLSSNVQDSTTVAGVGGLIGHLVLSQADLITVENNSVENIIITDSKPITGSYNWDEYGQYLPHAFVGNACQNYKEGEAATESKHSILFANNRILGTNTELSTCIYSSEYFGWGGNAEDNPSWKGKIYIDGQEWRPVFYMDAEGKYHVTNLEALKYFRDMVNGDKSFEGKTVLMDADIDMAGEAWTPIGNVKSYPSISFDGIFDGQNHTIDNLSCTDNTQDYACAALFGSIYGTIQNLKMTNVNINSTHYAAAIAAYSSSGDSKIINCSVIGGTITSTPEKINGVFDNGDKAGAIMGLNGEGGTIDNCYVEGVTITAYRDLGAIAGAGGVNKTTNNKAKNCTLIVDRTNFYGDKDVNVNAIVGRNLGGTLNANNTAENVTVSIPANSADAIRAAVKSVNAATSAGVYTITIANGTYELSDIAIAENAKNKTVTIKAAAKGGVTLKMNSDTKSKQIFLVDGYSGNYSSYRLVIDGFKFDLTAVTSGTAAPVYAFQAGDGLASTIGYTTKGPNLRYAHHITIQNCELVGAQGKENAMMFNAGNNTSPNNVVVKDSKVVNAGYLFSGYCDTFTATNVTATNVKHFVNNQGNGITVENCTVDCYTDYAIRANAGPVSITGSKFVMTYNDSDKGGIYVDRGNNTQLTMTGNTYPASYAGANMHDVYNEKNGTCILNGSITLQNEEYYDFPRN